MNERIKELAEQAKKYVDDKWAKEGPPLFPEAHYLFLQQRDEKFAELIVQECCRALNPMLRDMISRGQGVDLIKLHFGMNPNEITTAMLDAAITQCEQELAKKKSGVEE